VTRARPRRKLHQCEPNGASCDASSPAGRPRLSGWCGAGRGPWRGRGLA
jgi:hypothetical protein